LFAFGPELIAIHHPVSSHHPITFTQPSATPHSSTTMSSYDPIPDSDGIITQEEMRQSMKLVRLQITTPLSLLMAIGTGLVCALAVKPGLGALLRGYGGSMRTRKKADRATWFEPAEVSKMYPTRELCT
jgi:hypothetical protein